MLDGHPKDVQEIILRQRLDNEVRFKDHSLSRRDTMADTTQITNDNNTLSHLPCTTQSPQHHHHRTEKKELSTSQPSTTIPLSPNPFRPSLRNPRSRAQSCPSITPSQKFLSSTVSSLAARQNTNSTTQSIDRFKKANMSNWCQAVEELMNKYKDDIHTPEFLPVDQRMQQSYQG